MVVLMLFLLQAEQEKLKKKKRFDFLDILLTARVIETLTPLVNILTKINLNA